MVQVIGKDETQYREVTCKHCASRLRYLPVEVHREKSYDYTGSWDYVFHIYCPTCSTPVPVPRVD
jgi:hypothetical protein